MMNPLYVVHGDLNALPDDLFSPGNKFLKVYDNGAWKLFNTDGQNLFEVLCSCTDCPCNESNGMGDTGGLFNTLQSIVTAFVGRSRQRRADEAARGELQVAAYNAWRELEQAVSSDQCRNITPDAAVQGTQQIIDEFNQYCTSLTTPSVQRSCQNIVNEQQAWLVESRQLAERICRDNPSSSGSSSGSNNGNNGNGTSPQSNSLLSSSINILGFNVPFIALGAGAIALFLMLRK